MSGCRNLSLLPEIWGPTEALGLTGGLGVGTWGPSCPALGPWVCSGPSLLGAGNDWVSWDARSRLPPLPSPVKQRPEGEVTMAHAGKAGDAGKAVLAGPLCSEFHHCDPGAWQRRAGGSMAGGQCGGRAAGADPEAGRSGGYRAVHGPGRVPEAGELLGPHMGTHRARR